MSALSPAAAGSFVGRRDQLAALRRVLAGPPCVVLLTGEAGVGKSRLAAEVLAGAPGLVVVADCDDLREPLPLGPVLDGLRLALSDRAAGIAVPTATGPTASAAPSTSDRAAGPTASTGAATPATVDGPPARLDPARLDPEIGVLAPFLPGVAARLPAVPEPLADQPAERARLLRAMAGLLRALGPVVLALEDLQMADPVTLEFVDHLAARPVDRLTVLATMREGAGEAGPIGWRPPGTVRRVQVPPLARTEVGELAAVLLARYGATPPTGLPERFVTQLYERTAGIPFLVEEVIRSLVERGEIDRIHRRPDVLGDVLGGVAVPALLRDVLLWRMRPMDEQTREILGAAAVLGMAADERPLAAVLDLGGETVAGALRRATAAGLLHERAGRLWFRHTLARQVVYELLPAATRRLLHLRTARMLEEQTPRPVAQLAHHYRLAGSPADHVRNAEAAADLATGQGDDATAARFLLGTMEYPDVPRPVRVRLAVKLGRSAIDGVAQAEAIPVLRRILADRRLPPGARGELGLVLGRMLRQQGEARPGYEEIERAVPYLRHPGRRARALAILSAPDTVVGWHVGDHLRRCAEAADAARRSGDPSALLAVEIARLSLRLELGEPDAWPAVEAALADETFAAHPRERARACLNWAQGALHVGALDRAATLLETGRRLLARIGYERLLPLVELTELTLDLALDRLDGLEARTLRFLARPDRLPLAMLDARLNLARLRHRLGDRDRAESGIRAVIAEAARVGAIWPLVPARTALAALLLDRAAPPAGLSPPPAGLSPPAAETTADLAAGLAEAEAALDLVRGKGIPAWGVEAEQLRRRALDVLSLPR